MKAILISIKPQYVAKILNGEKTIEIRKTCPDIFKKCECYEGCYVYIYCTKEDSLCRIKRIDRDRYICGKDFDIRDFPHLSSGYDGKGKIVARFILRKTNQVSIWDDKLETKTLKPACLEFLEFDKYTKGYVAYAWHIENLEIFDKPKELSDFKPYTCNKCDFQLCSYCNIRPLTKAPQSWCYVEGGK